MKLSDMRGLDQDLNQGIKYNKRHGGPSDALKRIKKRPGGDYNLRKTRRDGYCFMDVDEETWERIFGKKK